MKRYPVNDNWYFTPRFSPTLVELDEPLPGLEPVRLPHTVRQLPFNSFSEQDYQMVSGYLYFLTPRPQWKGRRVVLVFEGAAHRATVYCNGQEAARHSCGYTAFRADITDLLNWQGPNNITVELDSRERLDQPPFGNVIDYLTYGGLYREVWLEVGGPACIEDLCIRADMDGRLECLPSCRDAAGLTLELEVTDDAGARVASWSGDACAPRAEMEIAHPRLWDCEHPALYTLTARLLDQGRETDCRRQRFGFRRVEFRPDGFYLNGKKLLLRGLNRHQSWPYLGYAAPARAQRLDADILKYELGCNAVRTSHYPQSQHFVDRCDEIGLLVFTEIPGWQYIGGEEWKQQALRNTEEMVLQYRNHPSIFLWGVRINESPDDDPLYAQTNAIAHQLDPTRPTGGVRNLKNSHLLEDVYTYNDFSHHGDNAGCEPRRAVTPNRDKGYLISEYNGHMFPTKACDTEEHRLEHALRHARVLADAASQPGIAGSFGWCMFDYNTHRDFGSGDRVCYHGVMDMFRNPKPAAAVYASQQEQRPVLEISSSMDIGEHPGGALGTIGVFTNADRVDLYRNDQLVGSYFPDSAYAGLAHPPVLIRDTVGSQLERNEGYSPRTAAMVKDVLFAVARYGTALPLAVKCKAAWLMLAKGFNYEKGLELFSKYLASWGGQVVRWRFDAVQNGKVTASAVRCPGEKLRLEVLPDTLHLQDGPSWDMATVRIRAVDEYGAVQTYCSRSVLLEAQGAVELIGPQAVPLCGGMAGCYLRTKGQAGAGRLVIRLEGAAEAALEFQVSVDKKEE